MEFIYSQLAQVSEEASDEAMLRIAMADSGRRCQLNFVYQLWCASSIGPILDVRFYATELGAEPVREWLKLLPAIERRTVGEDIKTVQFGEVTGDTAGRLEFGQGSAQTVTPEVIMGKKHIGSGFDEFLAEEAMLEEATAVAIKRVIAWQIAQEMEVQHLTKTALAKKMRTSRAALNRLLDENDASLTLTTLASAAAALGKKIDLRLAA